MDEFSSSCIHGTHGFRLLCARASVTARGEEEEGSMMVSQHRDSSPASSRLSCSLSLLLQSRSFTSQPSKRDAHHLQPPFLSQTQRRLGLTICANSVLSGHQSIIVIVVHSGFQGCTIWRSCVIGFGSAWRFELGRTLAARFLKFGGVWVEGDVRRRG